MRRKRFITGLGVGSLVIAGSLFMSSCSNKITEEQLAQINELHKQERSLTDMIQKKKDEKSKLESELSARKSELNKCDEQMDLIKKRLASWPDIWPDWKPAPPLSPEESPSK